MGTDVKKIDWALTATDRASPVFRGIETNMERLQGAVGKLTAILGVGGVVAGFVSMTNGAIESMAALHKLELQTGLSVEMLSALRPLAKQAGTDFEDAAGMINKLEKNMLTFAQTGSGKAADAFKQLGYSQADVQKGLKDMDAFLPEFAKRLITTGVGGEQAGLAMQLMAKGGAAALPFIKALAEAGALNAKVTGDQAEAAHQFEVNMVKLQGASNSLKLQIANALLPTLNDITQAMLDARKAGDGFFGAAFEGAKKATQALMGWNAAGDLGRVNKEIVELTDKWMGLEKMQGTRGISAERVAGVKAELDALIAKRNTLEGIVKMETPEKKEKERNGLADLPGKPGKADKEVDYLRIRGLAIIKEQQEIEAARAESAKFYGELAAEDRRDRDAREVLDEESKFRDIEATGEKYYERGQLRKAALQARLKADAKETSSAMKDLGFVMKSAFEDAIVKGNDLRSVLQGLLTDIAKVLLRRGVTDPLAEWGSNAMKTSGAGNWFSNMIGGGQPELLNTYASGTDYVPRTGAYQLHEGEAVIPKGENRGGGATFNITYNPTGNGGAADAQTMASTLIPLVRNVVRGEITMQLRPGGALQGA